MTRMTKTTRDGFRRALIAGALGAAMGAGAVATPALADTLGYYYDGTTVYTPAPPTTTTTTYTYTSPSYTYVEPAPVTVYEHREHRDRDHGAGIHLDTPIFDFGVGFH